MRYSHCIDLLRFLLMLTLMITSIKATVDISFFHNNINRSSGTIYFIPCIQLLSITKGSCLLSLIRYEFYYDSYCHHNYSNCLWFECNLNKNLIGKKMKTNWCFTSITNIPTIRLASHTCVNTYMQFHNHYHHHHHHQYPYNHHRRRNHY